MKIVAYVNAVLIHFCFGILLELPKSAFKVVSRAGSYVADVVFLCFMCILRCYW